jgi:hypothetical protein
MLQSGIAGLNVLIWQLVPVGIGLFVLLLVLGMGSRR